MRTSIQFRIFIQLISWTCLPGFLYQKEVKGNRAGKQRDRDRQTERERERERECKHFQMAATASIVNRPLENTSVGINKIIGICECVFN
jgi:hypothetical protein